MMILRLHREGLYQRDIAARVGCSPRTVRRVLARGGPAPGRRPGARASKLDSFKADIDQMLDDDIWNAEVIFKRLRERGYDGGRTLVQDYIRPKRTMQPSRATVRFETAPGRQLQHDWGEVDALIGERLERVHIAVNTLGCSRRFHVYAAPCEDAEHTYESLARAFEHFGGVTHEVLVDNQAPAVKTREQGQVIFNPRFVDMATRYGFRPRACRPYRARTKGKTERMVGYVKDHFFQRYRHFDSWQHLNQCLAEWLETEADPRRHGTHGEVVIERFHRQEAPALKPLPQHRFDTAYRFYRVVAWDGYIDVAGNRYSVPDALCGATVWCRLELEGQLRVYAGDAETRCVAEHVLIDAQAGWQSQPEHHQRLWYESMPVEVRDLSVYEEVV